MLKAARMRRKIHINRGTTLFECMHSPLQDTIISLTINAHDTLCYTKTHCPFPIPSVVHLIDCVLRGSQLPPLSGSARSIFISTSSVS